MRQLAQMYREILSVGQDKKNRTGVGTKSIFGYQTRFHLQQGFPLATRKFTPFKLIASELLWFLQAQQDYLNALGYLHENNNHIWDEWVKPDGSFGRIYGVQWRRWGDQDHGNGYDQIAHLIRDMKNNPESRRLIVSAWNPEDIADMALPPCHVLFQLNCREPLPSYKELLAKQGRDVKWVVDLQLYQRSCDAFLGVPFNVASYALLLHMLCYVCGDEYVPGDFVWTGGDVHLYENHLPQAEEYIARDEHPLPQLIIKPNTPRDIDSFTLDSFALNDYRHSGKLTGEVAV